MIRNLRLAELLQYIYFKLFQIMNCMFHNQI